MTNAATKTQPQSQPLPTSKEQLLMHLDNIGISYRLHEHEPIFTVKQGESVEKTIQGIHCRNLFLYDKKKRMFLITAANETQIDLKKLSILIESGRLSFCSPARLWDRLGITPGSVNPFCIMNDKEGTVRMVLDSAMMDVEIVNYHPMDNSWTIGMAPSDLLKFLDSTGHAYEIVDFAPAHPDVEE